MLEIAEWKIKNYHKFKFQMKNTFQKNMVCHETFPASCDIGYPVKNGKILDLL